ncbi:MAG: CCA tRNA nucleotidyltransferase [Candidatus Omnitrophica bacterium]|nr:CCA tRNA nucleotidyltransferase [Candidatus Omnitrophota bacterium]
MKEHFKALPRPIRAIITLISGVAVRKKVNAYLVGGFVRDLLLQVPNLDLDIAVEADALAFAESLAHRCEASLTKHERFGTATLIVPGGYKIDIATCRKETYPHPASLPIVAPSNLRDDLFRRDFTINAMAIALCGRQKGELIDFFGGKLDLLKKQIRLLHDKSFVDDPTRILRGIRFETRYAFHFERTTRALLQEASDGEFLLSVQPQRIRNELILLLQESHPRCVMQRVDQIVGLRFISPYLRMTKKTNQLLRYIEQEISWFSLHNRKKRVLEQWLVYLCGLCDTLSSRHLRGVCDRFMFRAREQSILRSVKEIRKSAIALLYDKHTHPARIVQFLKPLSFEAIIALKAKYRHRVAQQHISKYIKVYHDVGLLISGKDLRSLGIAPGPRYQKIFSNLLRAKLEGGITTKQQELVFIKKLLDRL